MLISTDRFSSKTLAIILFLFRKIQPHLDITAFIRELLFDHDCVIVPGFGGFIGNYTPARNDRNTGMFYPPVKQISFNRNLNHNDGLLVGRVAETLKTDFGDAKKLVEEFADELRIKLEKGDKIVFDHIGTFVNNHEGNVQFEPDTNINYHLDSYGLESFQCMPLESYDVRKRITRHIDRDPLRQASVRKVLWIAAVVIPLLVIMVAVPLKTDLFKAKVETSAMNPLVTAEFENNIKAIDENIVAGSEGPEILTSGVSEEPVATPEENVVPEAVPPVPADEGNFCIITGSFMAEANAISQSDMLRKEGFDPEIIRASNGFYRVSAMRCHDLNSAVIRRDSILKKFPGSWVSRLQ